MAVPFLEFLLGEHTGYFSLKYFILKGLTTPLTHTNTRQHQIPAQPHETITHEQTSTNSNR